MRFDEAEAIEEAREDVIMVAIAQLGSDWRSTIEGSISVNHGPYRIVKYVVGERQMRALAICIVALMSAYAVERNPGIVLREQHGAGRAVSETELKEIIRSVLSL